MLFKSFTLWQQAKPIPALAAAGQELFDHLVKFQFTETKPGDAFKTGFVSPVTKQPIDVEQLEDDEEGIVPDELFLHVENRFLFFCIAIEQRKVSTNAMAVEISKKEKVILETQGRSLNRHEKQRIKEEFSTEQLKTVAPERGFNFFVYDQLLGRFFVAGNSNQAEHVFALLRQALDGLPVLPVALEEDPKVLFGNWFVEDQKHFELTGNFTFKDIEDATRQRTFSGEEPLEHKDLLIEDSFYVSSLGLSWKNKVSFKLNEKLEFSGIKFADILSEQADDVPADDKRGRFMADILIGCSELNELLQDFFAFMPMAILDTGNQTSTSAAKKDNDVIPPLHESAIIFDADLLETVHAHIKETRKVTASTLQTEFDLKPEQAENLLSLLIRQNAISQPDNKGNHQVLLAPV